MARSWHCRGFGTITHVSKAMAGICFGLQRNLARRFISGRHDHGPLREAVFGGVTQALIEVAELPVLLLICYITSAMADTAISLYPHKPPLSATQNRHTVENGRYGCDRPTSPAA